MTASLLLNPAKSATRLKTLENWLFAFLVFFLPTQLGKHFWPDFALVAGIRIDYLSPTVFFTDILLGLLLVVAGIRVLVSRKEKTQGIHPVASQKTIALSILFLVFLFLSAGFSNRPMLAFLGIGRIVAYCCFGLLTAHKLADTRIRQTTALVFAISMLLQSFLAIAQFYTQGSFGGLLYYLGERTFSSSTPGIANASLDGTLVLRPYGTLPHPNVLAGYLLLGGLYMLSVVRTPPWQKVLLWSVFVISAIALILTLSRTAIFFAVIVAVAMVISRLLDKRRVRFRSFSLVVLFVIFCLVIFSPLLLSRFSGSDFFEESVVQRVQLLDVARGMIQDHLFLGVGPQHFLVALPEYQFARGYQLFIQPVHSVYALVAAELGIGGLCFFLYFLYKTYVHAVRRGPLLSILLFVTLLSLGLSDHYLITVQQGRLLLAFLLGYLWSSPK